MNKINKREIVDAMSEEAFISKKDADRALDAAIEFVKKSLLEGNEVNIGNFGASMPPLLRASSTLARSFLTLTFAKLR